MKDIKIRTSMTFVSADDQSIAMSASVDVGGEDIDGVMGLKIKPVAQVSFVEEESGRVLSSMFIERQDLARAITEMRAVYDGMEACASIVDRGWQKYRDRVRRRALIPEGGASGIE